MCVCVKKRFMFIYTYIHIFIFIYYIFEWMDFYRFSFFCLFVLSVCLYVFFFLLSNFD